MLQPARRKYRKEQKGRNKGLATRGAAVSFGEFGLKATGRGRSGGAARRERDDRGGRRGGRHPTVRPAVRAQDQPARAAQHDHRGHQAHHRRDPGPVIGGQVRPPAGRAADRVARRAEGQATVPAEPGHHVVAQTTHRADDLAGSLLAGGVAAVPPPSREPHRGDGATGAPRTGSVDFFPPERFRSRPLGPPGSHPGHTPRASTPRRRS